MVELNITRNSKCIPFLSLFLSLTLLFLFVCFLALHSFCSLLIWGAFLPASQQHVSTRSGIWCYAMSYISVALAIISQQSGFFTNFPYIFCKHSPATHVSATSNCLHVGFPWVLAHCGFRGHPLKTDVGCGFQVMCAWPGGRSA